MAKIYTQHSACVWGYDGGLASATCVNSGCFSLLGQARLCGIVFTDAALDPASGVCFQQSATSVPNWDYSYKNTVSASSGSAFSLECVGQVGRILIWATSDVSATSVRTQWHLRPV